MLLSLTNSRSLLTPSDTDYWPMTGIITDEPTLTFLIGGLGAGKTELALNLAVSIAETHGAGVSRLLDLDIVNPFFRVRKVADEVGRLGVNVVMPCERARAGDLPSLPPEVWGALANRNEWVTCDVGGGEVGLRVLGRLREAAENRPMRVLFVINPFRPGYTSLAGIEKNFFFLQDYSALSVTHLVANPHLVGETTPELFQRGLEMIQEFAVRVSVPVAFAMATPELISALDGPISIEMQAIRRFWRTPWRFGLEQEE
ncbi:MAG: hypothetical protein HQM09_12600 [Candidatus Riflebacteria bacterium]|nr:hypothetical protein [Candidatus Riflebacteria bacterium]